MDENFLENKRKRRWEKGKRCEADTLRRSARVCWT
jgi:hypothetical protein